MSTGSFPGVKCGRGVLLTTHPFQCRPHGRVELYLYPPSGPHRACNGITLPFLSSSYICHGVWPLVDPFRSHVSRSLFKGLAWFLLPVGEYCFITLGNLFRGTLFTCFIQLLLYSSSSHWISPFKCHRFCFLYRYSWTIFCYFLILYKYELLLL